MPAPVKAAAKATPNPGPQDGNDPEPFLAVWAVYEASFAPPGLYVGHLALKAARRPGVETWPPSPMMATLHSSLGKAGEAFYRVFPLRRRMETSR